MASIRNQCTKLTTNYTNDTNVSKCCAKIFDQTSGSHTNHCNNSHTNGTRPQLRWSQSFSPTDRQKPNVSTLIRRKSAVERLAETKYNYIKSSPPLTVDSDVRERQQLLHKSLSTSALKPSLVILTRSPSILSNTSVDCHPNQANSSNIKCQLRTQSSVVSNCSIPTVATPTATQTVTRKRNPSLSSRLSSEGSNYLEQQLRQLIAENSEEQINGSRLNRKKVEPIDSVIMCSKQSPEPKPRERIKTTLRQNFTVVPKQRTIFTNNIDKTYDKTIVDNKKTINNSILRYNSSHNSNNINKFSTDLNSKLIIQPNPSPPLRHKTVPSMNMSCTTRSTAISSPSARQLTISRSKSDVSNGILVRRNKSKDEIERFFETLGLDSTVWDSIRSEATNSQISTPANYFESCGSFESDVRHAVMSASSSSSSSDTRHSTSAKPTVERQVLNTRLMQSRSCHTLSVGTSIVEKNARVIKWLYNCRKAMVQH